MNHVMMANLNVCHKDCKNGFLSMQCSKLPIHNLANNIFRAKHQTYESPIFPVIQ